MLWDVSTGARIRSLSGHTDYVFDVDWSSDGRRLLSASRDSTVILWDTSDGTRLQTYRDEAGRSFTVSFLDDRHAVTGGSSSNVRFWSLYNDAEQRRIDLPGAAIYSMAVSDDEHIAALGIQNAVELLDLQSGTEIRHFRYAGGAVTSVAISPDGKTLLSGFQDASTILWNIENGQEIRRLEGHSSIIVNEDVQFGRILDVAVSPDGQRVLAGGEDKTMIVWDMNTGDIVIHFRKLLRDDQQRRIQPGWTTISRAALAH